jgi:hypothetical protein
MLIIINNISNTILTGIYYVMQAYHFLHCEPVESEVNVNYCLHLIVINQNIIGLTALLCTLSIKFNRNPLDSCRSDARRGHDSSLKVNFMYSVSIYLTCSSLLINMLHVLIFNSYLVYRKNTKHSFTIKWKFQEIEINLGYKITWPQPSTSNVQNFLRVSEYAQCGTSQVSDTPSTMLVN